MRASRSAFPGKAPPKALATRQQYITQHREELEAQFDPLDRKIWQTDLDAAARRYLDRNRAALIPISPAYAVLLRLQ